LDNQKIDGKTPSDGACACDISIHPELSPDSPALAGRRCRQADEGRPRIQKVLPSLRYAARAATDRLRRGGPWRSRADANRDRAPAAG
ncbi:hypothetical protein CN177_16850, partial [Sinorhizobium meliloti]